MRAASNAIGQRTADAMSAGETGEVVQLKRNVAVNPTLRRAKVIGSENPIE